MTIASYTDLQTAALAWLSRTTDTDLSTQMPDIIRLAEGDLRTDLNVMYMETENTAVSISSEFTALSTISSQLTEIRRMTNTSSSPYNTLRYRTPEQLIKDFPASTTGTPKVYTIEAQEIQLRPIPDGSYTFAITYRKWFDPLATTSTNTLLTNWPNVYLFATLRQACIYLMDDSNTQQYTGEYQKAVAALMHAGTKLNYSGRLTMRGDTGNP